MNNQRRQPSLLAPHPTHPGGSHRDNAPSFIEIGVDTGLVSGKLTMVQMTEAEAVAYAAKMVEAVAIVYRVNRETRS